MSPRSAPRSWRSGLLRRGTPEPARADTAPVSLPRAATRPLPVAAGRPPGDDTPTVVDPLTPPVAAPAPAALPGPGVAAGGGPRRLTVTRVAGHRVRELTGATVRRVDAASRSHGAGESGLSSLLWVNALHLAGDAMIAVSLAGTLFFAAPSDAQRGNVALYLLVTMAPFAVLAPVLGPLLDRLQRGRRWALAAGLGGRASLAVVMAFHHDGWALYPAALGVLVLSKGFTVLRAAVVPRVLPDRMSLTSANARLSVFGLLTSGLLGALGAGVAALLGLAWELGATAAVFTVAAVLALRLPAHVDVAARGTGPGTRPAGTGRARRVTSPHVRTALGATAALRGLAGFLTVFSAFLVQATVTDGWDATLALGGIAVAAGAGSVLGTGIGSRLHGTDPDRLVLVAAGVAAVVTVGAAVFFSLVTAAVVAGVSAVANALGKVALDAIVQREVPDPLRASAFARSETALQLAWVAGGALGIVLPSTGWVGFTVAAALLVLAVGLVLEGMRRGRAGRRLPRDGGQDGAVDEGARA